MRLAWGPYLHAPNEVGLMSISRRPIRGPRGRKAQTELRWRYYGELLPDPTSLTALQVQNDLNAKMDALERAYDNDYRDIGFFRDDGSLTCHYMLTKHDDNLTGNIVDQLTWAPGDRTEFASKRTYQIGVSALFRTSYSQVYSYKDTITRSGGGPMYIWRNTANGPRAELLFQNTYRVYRHFGHQVGLDWWLAPPSPLASGPNYLSHLTQVGYTSPNKFSNPGQYQFFVTTWSYTYIFPVDDQPLYPSFL